MKTPKFLTTVLLTAMAVASAHAQAPAPAAPAAQAPGGAGRGGRGGGGGGGAPAPTFTAEQYAALAKWNTTTLAQTATTALNALRQSSVSGASASELQAKADALTVAELALAAAKASLLEKVQTSPDKFNAEQLAFVAQNGGLQRPGNSSPGGTIAYNDYSGFTALWDGKTLNNWDGESDVWSIDHDAIHADTTKTPGQHHIHYVGPNPVFKDFDLKVEVKLGGGANGGLQYRGTLVNGHGPGNISRSHADAATKASPMGIPLPAGVTTVAAAQAKGITGNPWQLGGYQFDMNSPQNNYTGQLYENQGRGIVTAPGQIVQLAPGGLRYIIGTAVDNPVQFVKEHTGIDGEWNQFEVIARGNTLVHLINGHIISVTIDDDPALRTESGIMSLQLEGNGQIWYRNIYIKRF